MADMKDLMREYERVRFPADRRLDVHGEGPSVARDRVLHWIQSRAHESPGEELLVIAGRGGRPGRPPGAVEAALRELLDELQGRLVAWWQPFAPGSLALRISTDPSMAGPPRARPAETGEGRTSETAGAARPPPVSDIPPELLERARRVADLRIEREELSTRLADVVLREIWIETQALAMEHRLSFDDALTRVLDLEVERGEGWD